MRPAPGATGMSRCRQARVRVFRRGGARGAWPRADVVSVLPIAKGHQLRGRELVRRLTIAKSRNLRGRELVRGLTIVKCRNSRDRKVVKDFTTSKFWRGTAPAEEKCDGS